MSKKRRTRKSSSRRRAALQQAAADRAASTPAASRGTADARPVEPVATLPPAVSQRPRPFNARWPIGIVAVVLVVAVLIAIGLNQPRADSAANVVTPAPSIIVGIPGGEVIETSSPTPTVTAAPTPVPTPREAAASTPPPSVAPATPPPTPAPTPPRPPSVAPTPAPTAVVVALAGPDDAVLAFYRAVADGRFDAAYALWSDRMKATYPRQENLDDRFDETASIDFEALYVASQTSRTATVQANFVETYDSGGSRRFIGYWELVLVDGRWLLDAPHY